MEVKIHIESIYELKAGIAYDDKTLQQVSKIQFEAVIPPAVLARLLNLQRQRVPIDVSFSTTQATMDLELHEVRMPTMIAAGRVDRETGELLG